MDNPVWCDSLDVRACRRARRSSRPHWQEIVPKFVTSASLRAWLARRGRENREVTAQPMAPRRNLQARTYLFLALMVLFGSVGSVLLGKGMKEIGGVSQWSATALATAFFKVFTNCWIWLGIGSQLIFLFSFLLVLSWADYSYVFPASAIGYALVALLGYALLGEKVSPVRWTGVGLICLGVTFVGRTRPDTRKQS